MGTNDTAAEATVSASNGTSDAFPADDKGAVGKNDTRTTAAVPTATPATAAAEDAAATATATAANHADDERTVGYA